MSEAGLVKSALLMLSLGEEEAAEVFKFLGPNRQLLIKQARPHSFGRPAPYTDCREL